jgi:hydrogenase nickel incorporation protein HypA/HybF
MHELSIVQNIIGIVTREAEKAKAKRVVRVHLEIGKLSGVEFELIEFALKNLAYGSVIESAEFKIDKPGGRARCNKCGSEFNLDDFIGSCDKCNSFNIEIIKGRELRIKSITID